MEILADNYMGKPFEGPNDATLDSKGRIYFTDLAGSAVYRLDPLPSGGVSAPVRLLAAPAIQRANGIQVSPDDKRLYVIEANGAKGGARQVSAFDLTPDGNVNASSKKLHYNFSPGRSGDGMSIDTQGNLWVSAGMNQLRGTDETLATKTGVYVISPAGALLNFIPIAEDFITNNTFAGPDRKTCTSRQGRRCTRSGRMSPGWHGDQLCYRSGWPDAARCDSGCMCCVVARHGCRGRAVGRGAQTARAAASGGLEVLEIRPDFFLIAGAGGSIGVQVGEDGAVVVDAGSAASAASVVDAIKRMAKPIVMSSTRAGRRPRWRKRGALEGG